VRPTAEPTVVAAAPVRLTVGQARQQYLAVTRPYNVALERFELGADSGASLQTLQGRAKAVAAANLAESRQLAKIAWPTIVAAQIRQMLTINTTARAYWLKVAAADSRSAMAGHVRRAAEAGGKSPAAEIRRRLGLPEYNEADYR
jgi:hypothetical protein